MDREALERQWEPLAEEVISGMEDQHPKATFREIEAPRRRRSALSARSAGSRCRSEAFRRGDCRVREGPR